MTSNNPKPHSLGVTWENNEKREARDRVLAREVGIEIGRRREAVRHEREKHREFGKGFFCGFVLAISAMVIGIIGADYAKASTATSRVTIIGTGQAQQRITYSPTKTNLPPAWRTWLKICQAEQPAKGYGWAAVAWTNTKNHSFPGGCGLTRDNYTEIRDQAWPDTMNQLSPRDQLWACFRLYWKHARIGESQRGYEGGQRYGSTVWDVHNQIGFHGFTADGETRA